MIRLTVEDLEKEYELKSLVYQVLKIKIENDLVTFNYKNQSLFKVPIKELRHALAYLDRIKDE